MQTTSTAVSQKPCPLNQPSTAQNLMRPSLVTVLLLCGSLFAPSQTVRATPGDSAAATPAWHAGEADGEDDELDGDDDGSRALDNGADTIDVKRLRALTPAEEQSLLGDWGDAENED